MWQNIPDARRSITEIQACRRRPCAIEVETILHVTRAYLSNWSVKLKLIKWVVWLVLSQGVERQYCIDHYRYKIANNYLGHNDHYIGIK